MSNNNPSQTNSWIAPRRLAQVFRQRGHLAKAEQSYRELLELGPHDHEILLSLIEVLEEQQKVDEALDVWKEWLGQFPESHIFSHEAHKRYINFLTRHKGVEAAFQSYELTRRSGTMPILSDDAMLCCVVARNEMERLPWFLNYYRSRGVTHFFVVENDSTDGTLDFLLQQPDVTTWHSSFSFNRANCGAAWTELILRTHAVGRWVLWVDVDELLCYPNCEERSLTDLCQELDQHGYSGYRAVHVDMYSDRPINETVYESGTDFLSVCPWFDRQFFHRREILAGPFQNSLKYYGGLRSRVFGENDSSYLMNKTPLFRYDNDSIMSSGVHFHSRPLEEHSRQCGALLHFKYFASFQDYVSREIQRKQMPRMAEAQKKYARVLTSNQSLTLYDPLHSLAYQSSRQLEDLGVIRGANSHGDRRSQTLAHDAPVIGAVNDAARPWLSIMIPAIGRRTDLVRCVQSALAATEDLADCQLELVWHRSSDYSDEQMRSIVDEIGASRLRFYSSDRYLDDTTLRTLCVQRATGEWLQILDPATSIKPGFYQSVHAVQNDCPSVAAIVCGEFAGPFEKLKAGVLGTDARDNVIRQHDVHFSSMVVRRKVYKSTGGFLSHLNSAATWEMCQRIMSHSSVWYQPDCPVSYHSPAAKPAPMDALAAIATTERRQRNLSPDLFREARIEVALDSVDAASNLIQRGSMRAALQLLSEGIHDCVAEDSVVARTLHGMLTQIGSGPL